MRPLLLRVLFALICTTAACAEPTDDAADDDDATDDDDAIDDDDAADDDDATDDCGGIPTFADGLSPTAELHVATDGDDGAGDGSAAAPFATIDRAVQDAAPGTAIRVHEGTYAGFGTVGTARGTESAPIWIGGAPGEARPHIQGGGTGIQLVRGAYVVLHDLEVSGQTANGVNFDDGGEYDDPDAAHHIVLRGLSIHDVGDGNNDCLKLSGLNHFWVLDSEFARCGGGSSGSGVDMVGCHDGVIANNAFSEHSANGIQAKGGTSDVVIRGNHFAAAGDRSINMGGSTGFDFFRPPLSTTEPNVEARDLLVFANVFEGAEASLAYVGCVGCVVANNTLIDPDNWVLRILQETTSEGDFLFEAAQDGRFVNNVVRYQADGISRHVNVGADTAPETFQFSHNLWYASDDPAASEPTLPVVETDSVYGQDPAFTDAEGRIGTSSPAVGIGRPLSELAGDRDGNCWANPPAAGAYQPQ